MPELPEIETLRIGLREYLVGHKILRVEVRDRKILEGRIEDIEGAKVKDIKRIGKGLLIELNNNHYLFIHLKLTGQLIYQSPRTKNIIPSKEKVGTLPSNFTRVIFYLDKDSILFFNDMRRFALIKVLKKDELKSLPFLKEMGPEPFKDLTFEVFQKIIQSSQAKIKAVLMDQKKIGGVGNIYANEALFDAGIDPTRPANTLSLDEQKKLYSSILKVLREGLRYGGTSELTFVDILGREGDYQNHAKVYGKEGKQCPRCGRIIKKIQLGGRGTYFCEFCQK